MVHSHIHKIHIAAILIHFLILQFNVYTVLTVVLSANSLSMTSIKMSFCSGSKLKTDEKVSTKIKLLPELRNISKVRLFFQKLLQPMRE